MNNAHNGTIKQEKCLREHQDELKEFEHLGWLNDRKELLKKYNLLIDDGFKYASQLLYHPCNNGRRYETLGISELRNYQPIRTLPASDALGIPLKPQCFMTAC